MSLDLPRITKGPADTNAVGVARSLLDHLLLPGKIKVGERLPSERELAEAFGVGRSAVREALKALNLLGLVEIRQGDGTYLRSPNSDLLPQVIEWGLLLGERRTRETIEARRYIEVAIARLAAERRDPTDVDRLETRLEELKSAVDDPTRFVDADVAFHLELARVADNRVLADILTSLQSLLRAWMDRVIRDVDDPMAPYQEHENVFLAVRLGDPEAAERAMAAHIHSAGEKLVEALARNGVRDADSENS